VSWHQPSSSEISTIINNSKRIAIVGASKDPARAAFFVLTYLKSSTEYTLFPVNPKEDEILGLKVYHSLQEIAEPIDVCVVFRRHDVLDEVLDEAIAAKAKVFWMQLGIHNDAVAERGVSAGLTVVQNKCIKIEHARFHGGLHLAGFDTGVITSKRLN